MRSEPGQVASRRVRFMAAGGQPLEGCRASIGSEGTGSLRLNQRVLTCGQDRGLMQWAI
ncbi:hypothetical protein BEI_3199 [Halomonas beimenensis]|uniref:Uncharacterized protein n=1 Tax=Halomonas beimenensis TaxID=475662 RepID=A0A291PBA9_9GAMM|nr:hypothetical protein BEI_3199 [Halomonas beimenensis]